MTPTFTVDTRDFDAALRKRMADTRRSLPELVNQTAFNVAARAMRGTKQASGSQVRDYLGKEMGATYAGGGNTGSYTPAKQNAGKRAARRLRRVVLIAQAVFYKKHGYGIGKGKSNKRTKRLSTGGSATAKGKNDYGHSFARKAGKMVMGSDYGDAMKKYAGKMLNKAVRSVGYLSAMWVPVLRSLAPVAKFKGLAKGLRYGVLWKTSSAFGSVVPAREGASVAAVLDVTAGNPRTSANAQRVVRAALQGAIDAEAVEMRRHMEKKLASN